MSEITPLTKDQLFEKKIAENTGSDYNVGDISDVVPVTKDQSFLKEIALNSAGQSEDITELEEKVSATQDMISDAYDATATYAVGDYCIYNNILYRCNTAIATGEAFTPAKWDAKSVMGQIRNMELKNVTPAFAPDSNYIDQYEAYQVGNIVYVRFRTKSVNIPNNTHVFTIDHNFLPIFGTGFPVYIFTSGIIETGGAGFVISDGTNGNVELYGLDSNINQLLATFSYVIY